MKRFEGRRVLVTGGGSGIGRATVIRLLAEGATVVAADVVAEGLSDLEKAGGADRLHTHVIDIGDEDSVRSGVAASVDRLGGLDVLVNAAGVLRSAHTESVSLDDWDRIIRINLTGTFLMIRESLPALIESGHGVIVNFSSTSASFAHPYMAAYAASKGGIWSLTHTIALEFASKGIRAVTVAPGSISSGITASPGLPEDADFALFTKLQPALAAPSSDFDGVQIPGMAGPDKVASVVAMLASDDGAFITGTEVRVDGGSHM
ncbi:SDR family NAD(P)-dependent oxidoreductase [Gordonia terrae]|uniref:SDR family NAD(P)-dependent oxidoreductase n=2 Tax=Gordonia terrae TaxID=2055 RepID=A0AAD0KAK9_9ACTN|nr:SDR family NAD(P)-dependent oxidoreductase [Gordonia terrae]VTR09630.1 3-oxoacyl-(acyl-carrier-protein) reductase [Clostridioides difficile]ANY22238.1 short-chain dehydrogenase [Gordonia terrae]AWO82977.1 SDR family NAD(P)-dependent oxidoreductase [Gordonia terrae]VTS30336.1 Levodione reductase [Gordonia terrae]GAB46290.1 putative oxidoreductase [Gordonia terrae NBRC 100016]